MIEFATERLQVAPWHRGAERLGVDLVDVVRELLTSETTAELPHAWRGEYDVERAERWVVERDGESPTLLATSGEQIVGLLIVFEHERDLRLGYVIDGELAGRGYATELVGGLIAWAQAAGGVDTITGGVSATNGASARVLERNGFEVASRGDGELTYRRHLSAAGSA